MTPDHDSRRLDKNKLYAIIFFVSMLNKVIVLAIISVFLISAAGFCDAASSIDDNGHHCVICCSAGCHGIVLPPGQITTVPSLSASFIQFDAALRQEPFLRGIEYPPKSII